jgi:hypothetical protein
VRAPGPPEDLSSPAKKLVESSRKPAHCAAISTNHDVRFVLISQRAFAVGGLVIGLAMILIVIAMVSIDEHCTPAQRLKRLGIARRATLGCCSRTSDPERHQGMGLLVFPGGKRTSEKPPGRESHRRRLAMVSGTSSRVKAAMRGLDLGQGRSHANFSPWEAGWVGSTIALCMPGEDSEFNLRQPTRHRHRHPEAFLPARPAHNPAQPLRTWAYCRHVRPPVILRLASRFAIMVVTAIQSQ